MNRPIQRRCSLLLLRLSIWSLRWAERLHPCRPATAQRPAATAPAVPAEPAAHAEPPVTPHPTLAPAPVATLWHPLPGNVLELADTGFRIEMRLSFDEYPFHLYTPEGRRISWGGDLDGLKQLAERQAAFRAAFSCPPATLGWAPKREA